MTRSAKLSRRDVPDAPPATLLPRLLATAADPGFDAHFRQWGQMPGGGPLLIEEIDRAGLRGRGGASFPTGKKLAAVAAGNRPVVVANGTEAEPLSHKDKTLLASAPHLVLDGVSIAAETVGADQAVVCVERGGSAAARALSAALAERRSVEADAVDIRLEEVPRRYVAGEESALVHWLNGGEAKPTFVPPRPFERGVGGRATLVNNVETLANVALIARFGAGWFRSLGTAEDPGSALVTILGDVERAGVYEFALGSSVETALRSAGVGPSAHAVLSGAFAGTWLPVARARSLTVDRASFAAASASLGCGSLFVHGSQYCGLATTARIAGWMASQSAGQCGPCLHGLPAVADALDALAAGDPRGRWEAQLRRWLDMLPGRGACHHPDGTVRMIRSALTVFADDIAVHRKRRSCGLPPAPVPVPAPGATSWR
ncbi:MAG TPA: NADH-ubiquinone oxidoreductase-F iron-sulfur binding region domain-containing protein [Acidimicrobiales bacterium]|nr:NADH-ubiquinone oxidoreductase-F iron-sulfur binding region domain-containing protein [Acidimicrobiales bacterium]